MIKKALTGVVTNVEVEAATVRLIMSDGSSITRPIERVGDLKEATADQRAKWAIVDDGRAVEWREPKARLDLTEMFPAGDGVAREDLVLYAFVGFLLVGIAVYFWQSSELLRDLLHERATDPKDQMAFLSDNPVRSYIGAQVHLTLRRYDHAAAILLANSTRNNTGFLVGTLFAFMGGLLVVRRVRDASFQAAVESASTLKASLTTASPGIVLAALGTAVILTTLISREKSLVEDEGIVMPAVGDVPVSEAAIQERSADKAVDTQELIQQSNRAKALLPK